MECLKSFITSLILGEAYPILLMRTIYLIINGASRSLMPKPHIIKKGSQGIIVAPCNFINHAYNYDY